MQLCYLQFFFQVYEKNLSALYKDKDYQNIYLVYQNRLIFFAHSICYSRISHESKVGKGMTDLFLKKSQQLFH